MTHPRPTAPHPITVASQRQAGAVAIAETLLARGHDLGPRVTELLQRDADLRLPDGAVGTMVFAREPFDPATATLEAIADAARSRALVALCESSGQIHHALDYFRAQVRDALAAELADRVDGILDDLRPAFGAAAQAVHEATKLGVRARIRPEQVINLGDKAVAAWRALPAHITELAAVSRIRLAFTDDLGVPPATRWVYDTPPYTLCFRPTPLPWSDHTGENEFDKWLRLSAAGPLRLLSIEETLEAIENAKDAS